MSDHIDWTEQAGEAVLAQTDDVLGSIRRLRATAQENGYFVDNEAQDVQTEGDTIVIAQADPQVVLRADLQQPGRLHDADLKSFRLLLHDAEISNWAP